jgi:hypothetical protein
MSHLIDTPVQRGRPLAAVALLVFALICTVDAGRASATYEGHSAVVAFQAPSGELLAYATPEYTGESGRTQHTSDGVEPGTSPSVVGFPLIGSGYTVAFHASGPAGHLWIYTTSTSGVETPLGMEPGTSPSITQGGTGYEGYTVAFDAQGSGRLWTYEGCSSGCTPIGHETALGVSPGTSPSISSSLTAGRRIAFQAAVSHRLWIYDPETGVGTETPWQVEVGTSPSITMLEGNTYKVAFQGAGTHRLWTYSSSTEGLETPWQMETGTSPSIATLPGGGWKIAFQGAGSHDLWTDASSGEGINNLDGMATGTSPGISRRENNSNDEVAFQANTGTLWAGIYPNASNTGLAMAANTSPSIAPLG